MDAVVTTLRTVSLFAELPREVLARLVSEFDDLEIPAGRIESETPTASARVPEGARRFDGTGYTVIPGLVGLHDHL